MEFVDKTVDEDEGDHSSKRPPRASTPEDPIRMWMDFYVKPSHDAKWRQRPRTKAPLSGARGVWVANQRNRVRWHSSSVSGNVAHMRASSVVALVLRLPGTHDCAISVRYTSCGEAQCTPRRQAARCVEV